MLPHHIVTAVTVLTVDLGHTLGCPCPAPVGAAIFTGRITQGRVAFDLDSCVLAPSDSPSRLLHWLDETLFDEHATVTGYDLPAVAASLAQIADADWSPVLRILSGCGHHPLLDTRVEGPDHRAVPFAQVATTAGIPCALPDPDDDFTAWMTGRPTPLAERLETDVIACWRLAMTRIAARSALGRRVDAAIARHLAEWLRCQPGGAAARHLDSLTCTRG